MFIALERLLNLHEGYRQVVNVQGRSLLLLVVEGRALLLDNRCPHQGAPLHHATITGQVLRCARHGIEFDLASMRALNGACAGLNQVTLVYDGDRIGVEV